MDQRIEWLKNCCLVATVHERMHELNLHPDTNAGLLQQIDFCEGTGRDNLIEALQDYFLARAIDLRRPQPQTTRSTFAQDVAMLAARMVGKGSIFRVAAPKTTIAVIGRLLVTEGWGLKSQATGDHSAEWRKDITDLVACSPDQEARQRQIQKLFANHWEFKKKVEGAFEADIVWAKRIGLWPET
jgi:hypothetical protein